MIFFFTVAALFLSLLQKFNSIFICIKNRLLSSIDFIINDFKINTSRVQQIINLFVIYFEIGNQQFVMVIFPTGAYILKGKCNNAFSLMISKHCIGLSRSCLAIHKNSPILLIYDKIFDNPLATLIIDLLVLMIRAKCIVTHKLVLIIFLDTLNSTNRFGMLHRFFMKAPRARWYISYIVECEAIIIAW